MTDVIDPVTGATNPEEVVLDLTGIEDPEELKATIAKKDEAIKQILARAKSAEEENKALKAAAAPAAVQTKNNAEQAKDTYSRAELDLRMEGYTDSEVDFIIKNGGKEALKSNPIVQAAVKASVEQRKSEAAVAGTEGAKSDFGSKHTEAQVARMSSAEIESLISQG